MSIPQSEYAPYAKSYVYQVVDNNPLELLHKTQLEFYESIPSHKLNYRYEANKWTIAEMMGHIIDTERIFSYRALRIGRGDTTPLQGFEQDDYIITALSGHRPWISLLDEYMAVRQSTFTLFMSFSEADMMRIGSASNHPVSARALLHMIVGHELHHIEIIKDRYL